MTFAGRPAIEGANSTRSNGLMGPMPEEQDVEVPSTVDACAARGKELLQAGKTESAIACFSKALELSVAEHGPMATACADAYYSYADALLQKAQGESDPFGDAVQKLEDEDEDEGEEDADNDEVLVGTC